MTLDFDHAWWLTLSLAAVIPLLLHLWRRPQEETIPWAAFDFLLDAVQQDASRLRLTQLTLLALRCLLLAMFAVALAGPVLKRSGVLAENSRTHFLLVFDTSYSMAVTSGGQSLLHHAKEIAKTIVENSKMDDSFTLISVENSADLIVGPASSDRNLVRRKVDELQVAPSGFSLQDGILAVQKAIEESTQTPECDMKVILFTDLQRHSWEAKQNASVVNSLARLAKETQISIVEIKASNVRNFAITDLNIRDSPLTIQRPIQIEIWVQSFSTEPTSIRVDLYVDSILIGNQTINLKQNERSRIEFLHRFENAGDHSIEARIRGDDLSVDDHRYLAARVQERIRVLCIEGQTGDARYIAAALQSGDGLQIGDALDQHRVDVSNDTALFDRDIREYDCVILCNLTSLITNESRILGRFVNQGGGLIVFLGDQVDSRGYQRLEDRSQPGLLAADIGDLVTCETATRFDPQGYQHAMFQIFKDATNAGFVTTPTWRYFKLVRPESARSRIALAFENGDPSIIETSLGHGTSILVATSATDRPKPDGNENSKNENASDASDLWTAWPLMPSFPPALHEMLNFSLRASGRFRNWQIGQSAVAFAKPAFVGRTVELIHDSEPAIRAKVTIDSDSLRIDAGEIRQPGFHRLAYSEDLPDELFSANVDVAESDLAAFDRGALPSSIQVRSPTDFRISNNSKTASERSLFRLALLLVLSLLIGELGLATYLGRDR